MPDFTLWRGRTLLISSRDDTDTFGRFPELNEAYPRAEVRVFETGGHHTPMLFPVEFTRLVAEFADSTRGGAMMEGDRAGKKD